LLAGLSFDQDHDPQVYDGRFKDLFQEIFDAEFADQFKAKGIATSTG
jgi:isocitrate dehydrogenase